jgi:ribosomal protein L11 methyltransferase
VIADYLSSLGAAGVEIRDAEDIRSILRDPYGLSYADDAFLNSLDERVQMAAYFQQSEAGILCQPRDDFQAAGLYDGAPPRFVSAGELETRIRSQLEVFARHLPVGPGFLGWQEVRDEDWAEQWKKYYQTLHLTSRLVVNPSWISYQPAAGEVVIQLDPGSAFGTGTHETTAMCAEWLDELLLPGDKVLDLGCGSGILAIIACKLGAGAVEALDIDPLAAAVAAANTRANQAAIDCHAGELADARGQSYDIIVANIIADVVAAVSGPASRRLAPDGLFIASGIIGSKLDAVLEAVRQADLELLAVRGRGDWRSLVGQKRVVL